MWCQVDHPAVWVVPALGFTAFLRQFCVNVLRTRPRPKPITCFRTLCHLWCCDIMGVAWHHMCSGHVTFVYKRMAGALFEALFCSFSSCKLSVRTPGLPLSTACGWCLMRVGCNASSTSPGWSLLPSSVIIVLALVSSAMSHGGLWYFNETLECHPAPCQYRFHRTAVPFGWCL